MGIQKITFEGGNVTSKVDADLYHFLFSADVGILKGLKGECDYTLANNTITFSDGYVSIYGRIIYIENQTSIGVSPDSNKHGFVVLGVNTSDQTASLYLKEQTGSYPSLTRTNLNKSGGLYELVLCAYTKTTTALSLSNYERFMIEKDKIRVDDLDADIKSRYLPKRKTLNRVMSGTYTFSVASSVELMDSIVYVTINNSTIITFPGEAIFLFVGSNTSIAYRFGSGDYSLGVVYENGTVTLSAGSSIHNITSVFLKK
ncbi:hypothetical protein HF295_04535 [Hujiaoplasma nucleasis]|uniref:Uncharacterized protein n=1 Tax=Hujiaoplasma nucleasis TaxID=2725268 RepID=A0A7L6N4G2_9MOLU|nr:hypothetical protein [Hujiaoplasma nucleasis]QLY40167.1 hypothetical protein HF295_04535 [Hujiaoplasma nucleasis]